MGIRMEWYAMSRLTRVVRGTLLPLLAVATTAPALAASFDCRRPANGVERMVCANRELSQLDDRLAVTYKQFMSTSSSPYEDQREHQIWLSERNGCRDAVCLRTLYSERLQQLRSDTGGWLVYRAADQGWVATAKGDAVCEAARAQLEALGGQDFAARGPAQSVGVLCGASGHDCPAKRAVPIGELAGAGIRADASPVRELLAADGAIAVARVDLDNNGVPDLHLAQRTGQDQCERSVALLAGNSGRIEPAAGRGYDLLNEPGKLCGRERLAFFRYRDANYTVALGEQRVLLLRGGSGEGLQPVCGFKRRWTEQEKRAAYAVLKRYPDILRGARILRPEKDKAPDGRRVWSVQVRCETGSLRASFHVDPRTLNPRSVVEPASTARCDTPRMARAEAEPAPGQRLALQEPSSAGPQTGWGGLPSGEAAGGPP
jgi:uncharacterized protein